MTEDKIEERWREDVEYLIKRALEEKVSVEWYVHHMLNRLANRTDKLAEDIDWLREPTSRPDAYRKKIMNLQHALYVETSGEDGIMKDDNPYHKGAKK